MIKQQKIPERFWCIKQLNIFSDLAEADAYALAKITTFKELKYGESLCAEGVYLLKEGRIKFMKHRLKGNPSP